MNARVERVCRMERGGGGGGGGQGGKMGGTVGGAHSVPRVPSFARYFSLFVQQTLLIV